MNKKLVGLIAEITIKPYPRAISGNPHIVALNEVRSLDIKNEAVNMSKLSMNVKFPYLAIFPHRLGRNT